MVLKLASKGGGPALVAREIALDVAQGIYVPRDAIHVPGVANILCDALSRVAAPTGHAKQLPARCRDLARTLVAPRGESFWRTASSPPRRA